MNRHLLLVLGALIAASLACIHLDVSIVAWLVAALVLLVVLEALTALWLAEVDRADRPR